MSGNNNNYQQQQQQSQQQSSSSSSSSSYTFQSYSSQSVTDNSGTRSRETYSDPQGTTVREYNKPSGSGETEVTTRSYDSSGRALEGGGSDARRIEEIEEGDSGPNAGVPVVTDEEQERRDREYEERMEDEYAKREGGA